MLVRRRVLAVVTLGVIACGCDSSTGPVIPSTATKQTDAAPPPTTAPKIKEKGKDLNSGEVGTGGLPTKATP
jgi:hypothetical protein